MEILTEAAVKNEEDLPTAPTSWASAGEIILATAGTKAVGS